MHSHHPFLLGDTALRIAAEFDLPIVFTHHTLYEHFTHYVPLDSPRMERFAVELATSYANLCDIVFAPSESLAAILRERGVRSRVAVVPTGVDLARFAAADGAAFRRARDIPAEAIAVGHVGRLAAEKNLAFLANALAKFAAVDPRVHVLIAGDGPEAPQIRSRFAECGLGDRLHLVGVLQGDPLAAAYRAMDVFAFSSRTETQGLVLAEAMAAGVPVVAIDAPGAREVVRDRLNGRLLFSETVDDFVAALVWVVGARESLRAGALETAGGFSIDRTGERGLALYQELVQSSHTRATRDHRAWSEVRRRLRAGMAARRASRPVGGALVGVADGIALSEPAASPLRLGLVPRAFGWVCAALLRLLAATWRIDATAALGLTTEPATPRLVGFWHGKYFGLLALVRGIQGTVLIGAGFRGNVIAAMCERLGYTAVQIARRDRERAIARIRAALRSDTLCATALDGPVGPARRVKASLIRLAAETGAEIVPVSVVAAPRLVLGWRWDRREIPLPLARVRLAVGAPIAIPRAASGEQLEEWRWRVGHRIDELERPDARAEVAPAP